MPIATSKPCSVLMENQMQNCASVHQPNIALQLTPTASLLVPCASLRRR